MAEACVETEAENENRDIQRKPEETVKMSTSNNKECARSSEPEILIDNSCEGKTFFTVICAGPYGGGWSKGVYIEDYTSSDETVKQNPCNLPVIGASRSLKCLYDKSDKKIQIAIWNLAESEAYIPFYHLYCRSADGAIVFWSPATDDIENVLKYKNKVMEGKPDLPVVLLVDNVCQTSTKWMGQGLTINSQHEMDNFCFEHGFFAWFEMRERAGGENSVFGQAMSTLINEIICRNRIPEAY